MKKSKIVRSDMMPQLHLKSISKYVKDLNKESLKTSYAGDTAVEVDNTEYSFSAYLSMNYNFFYNFGSGYLKYQNSLIDHKISKIDLKLTAQESKLKILEAYIDSLRVKHELASAKVIQSIKQDVYTIALKLHKAGKIEKIDLVNSAMEYAEQGRQANELHNNYLQSLNNLSVLTYQDINSNTELYINKPIIPNDDIYLQKLPEIDIINKQIKQKQNEYKVIQRQRLPSIAIFANYSLYNTSEENYRTAYTYAKPESSTIGFSISMPIFEGFRKTSQTKALRHELNTLRLELKQKIHEKQYEITALKSQLKSGIANQDEYSGINRFANDKAQMSKKTKG